MKIKDYLKANISNKKHLPLNVKKLVFYIIQNALIKIYGKNYSDRCLQSSVGIIEILKYFNINTVLVEGSVCIALVYGDNPYKINYGGFWDKDHHYWVVSQFNDIIDFTISQFHLHPATKFKNQIPILPIWWCPAGIVPNLFRYLPENYGQPVDKLEKNESILLQKFKEIIITIIEEDDITQEELKTIELLTDEQKLNMLYEENDTWARVTGDLNDKLEFPNWIKNKERELLKKYYNRIGNGS